MDVSADIVTALGLLAGSFVALFASALVRRVQPRRSARGSGKSRGFSANDKIRLLANVDRVAEMMLLESTSRAQSLRSRIDEAAEDLNGELLVRGQKVADELTQRLAQQIAEDVEKTSLWTRIGFNAQEYVNDQITPLVLEAYTSFLGESEAVMERRFQAVVGEGVRHVVSKEPPIAGADLASTPKGKKGLAKAAGIVGLAGGAAGSGGAAVGIAAARMLSGPVTLAIIAGAGVTAIMARYESRDKIKQRLQEASEALVVPLFGAEGYRRPDDGQLIPSAPCEARKACEALVTRLRRRVDEWEDGFGRQLKSNSLRLKTEAEQDETAWRDLEDLQALGVRLGAARTPRTLP